MNGNNIEVKVSGEVDPVKVKEAFEDVMIHSPSSVGENTVRVMPDRIKDTIWQRVRDRLLHARDIALEVKPDGVHWDYVMDVYQALRREERGK